MTSLRVGLGQLIVLHSNEQTYQSTVIWLRMSGQAAHIQTIAITVVGNSLVLGGGVRSLLC